METTRKKVRSIFVSDIHVGCHYCKASEFHDFLEKYQPENLYLIGDIFDGERMYYQGIYWESHYTRLIQKIIEFVQNYQTEVYYAVGNHDEFLKDFLGDWGHIHLREEFIHITADGRKLLVLHGDYFDNFTKHAKWLYNLGDKAYNAALFVNKWFNEIRRKLGMKYWAVSSVLKQKVSQARSYINNFEELVVKYTHSKKCDGVICGHVHAPKIGVIRDIQYFNCGDWIEHCTALVENYDGSIELVWYH